MQEDSTQTDNGKTTTEKENKEGIVEEVKEVTLVQLETGFRVNIR